MRLKCDAKNLLKVGYQTPVRNNLALLDEAVKAAVAHLQHELPLLYLFRHRRAGPLDHGLHPRHGAVHDRVFQGPFPNGERRGTCCREKEAAEHGEREDPVP